MMVTGGRIFQLNISSGGVPKQAVFSIPLDENGLDGDDHNNKRYHGGLERAVCLYSLEQILALQDEGHPVFPGAMGENITTVGIDLGALTPGDRLLIGNEALIEVSSYTAPCKTIARAFRDGDYSRVSQKRHPGWSRLYGRVIQAGKLQVGQEIRIIRQRLEPAGQ